MGGSSQVYLRNYAFGDDYTGFASVAGRGGLLLVHQVMGGGRPLLALILQVSFTVFEPIDGLRPLRLLGVVGVALFGLVALTALVRLGMDRRLALPPATAMCFLPPFHSPAAWATTWEIGATTSDLSNRAVAEPLAQLVLEQRGIEWPFARIDQVVAQPAPHPRVFVLDTTARRNAIFADTAIRCPRGP